MLLYDNMSAPCCWGLTSCTTRDGSAAYLPPSVLPLLLPPSCLLRPAQGRRIEFETNKNGNTLLSRKHDIEAQNIRSNHTYVYNMFVSKITEQCRYISAASLFVRSYLLLEVKLISLWILQSPIQTAPPIVEFAHHHSNSQVEIKTYCKATPEMPSMSLFRKSLATSFRGVATHQSGLGFRHETKSMQSRGVWQVDKNFHLGPGFIRLFPRDFTSWIWSSSAGFVLDFHP